jgi:hypothetical protein
MRNQNIISIFKQKLKKIKEVIEISKELKANFFHTFIDIIAARIKYKATPGDYKLYKFYQLSEAERNTFFTGGHNRILINKLNDVEYINHFSNKEIFNSIFNKYLKRQWCINKSISYSDFDTLTIDKKYLVYKPLNKSAGEGIEKIELSENNKREIYNYIVEKDMGLIEEFIIQHPQLSKLCENSVNTLRVVTINDNGRCHIVYTCLRMGVMNIVDNLYSGGILAAVSEVGIVCSNAYNLKGEEHARHPISGMEIKGFKIPYWEETLELIEAIYNIIPQIKYIGWDIAITQTGPIVVEGNARYPSHEVLELPYVDTKKGNKRILDKYLNPSYRT